MIASRRCTRPEERGRSRAARWLLAAGAVLLVAVAPAAERRVLLLDVRGGIGPALADFVERGIAAAHTQAAAAVILRLDTPGGLDTSMRAMIKSIIAAPLPVVVYVAPGGARAASAGTYLLYASHVAAMAPGTNLGAATPVPLGPGMTPPGGRKPAGDGEPGEGASPAPGDAMQRKVVNDAAAYLRALAEMRGRNAAWAETAVREGASLSAEQALADGVIDVLASSVEDLLRRIDGRTVDVGGEPRTLRTADWAVETLAPDWRTELLAVITNPNVAYLLLLLGVYGLIFELYSPGALVPGIAGVISLLLALYALHLLPVSYAGAALIVVGIALMSAELVTPTFGALGVGGAVAFVAGSVMLFDTEVEGFTVSIPLIVTVSAAFAALLLATVVLFARQRRRPVVTGREEMFGAVGHALEDFSRLGRVHVHGESWAARTRVPLARGDAVRVLGVDGLTLEVEPADAAAPAKEN